MYLLIVTLKTVLTNKVQNHRLFWNLRNVSVTLFWTLSLTLTFSLDKINVCPTTLRGFYFQSLGPTLISPNKRVSVIECLKDSVASTTLENFNIIVTTRYTFRDQNNYYSYL